MDPMFWWSEWEGMDFDIQRKSTSDNSKFKDIVVMSLLGIPYQLHDSCQEDHLSQSF